MAAPDRGFVHYQCWKPDRVEAVINLEAERAERDTFLAVHTDRPILVATALAGGSSSGRFAEWTTERFRQALLAPSQRNVSAVVVGESGSGKSHLIKWLSTHIEESPQRIVLTIPKSGTSLRNIIRLILERLPADVAQPYVAALDAQSYDDATPEGRRRALAAFIAMELERFEPRDKFEQWLVPGKLPLLFRDIHLVDKFLVHDGGVLDRLVDHVGEKTGPGLPDDRLEFTIQDLPRPGGGISEAAAETRGVMNNLIGDPAMEEAAVRLVNAVIAPAIARAVAFPPEKLQEAMQGLRRHLAANGQELVLLIEDFARLEGIDGGLLQALIEDGGTGTDLCVMRWCMAVTRGPFTARVRDTLKTRLSMEVDMDGSAIALASSEDELALFAGHYLNAMRLSAEATRQWVASGAEQPIPSACSAANCQFLEECHDTFGAADDIGLYPFTRQALVQLQALVSSSDAFNPREFIKGVLKPTFVDHDLEWNSQVFPSGSYHGDLSGPSKKISPAQKLVIEQEQPVETDRFVALLDLWGDGTLRIDPRVGRAFGLKVSDRFSWSNDPSDEGRDAGGAGEIPVDPEVKVESDTQGLSLADRKLLDAISAWGLGRDLEAGSATQLRKKAFDALEGYIDWDDVGLSPAFFVKGGSPARFRVADIAFQGQLLAKGTGAVRLEIPAAPDEGRLRASIALQALVILTGGGSFKVDEGPQAFAELQVHLEAWSKDLLSQLRKLADELGPLDDAVDLLLYRAALSGGAASSAAGWIESALAEPRDIHAPNSDWQRLYDDLAESRTQAREYVRARISASKGGQPRAVIDPRVMLEGLHRFESGLQPPIASGLSSSPVSVAAGKARAAIPALVEQEAQRQRQWRAQYLVEREGAESFAEFRNAIVNLQTELVRCGIAFSREKADAAIASIDAVNGNVLDQAVLAIGSREEGKSTLAEIAHPGIWQVLRAWSDAKRQIDEFLREAEASLRTVASAGTVSEARDRAKAAIEPLLADLISATAELEALA